MTRRPFDPDELGQPPADANRTIPELESYLADTATGAPHGLVRRVMAGVEEEPAPNRRFLGWLLAPSGSSGGLRRLARASVLAATLVLAVGGAIFAGQLTGLIRNVGNSPTEVESVSPSPSASELPSRTISEEPSSSESPGASEDAGQSPRASGAAGGTEAETPDASDDGGGSASGTPRPTKTASPTPSGASQS